MLLQELCKQIRQRFGEFGYYRDSARAQGPISAAHRCDELPPLPWLPSWTKNRIP